MLKFTPSILLLKNTNKCISCFVRFYSSDKPEDVDPQQLKYLIAKRINQDKQQNEEQQINSQKQNNLQQNTSQQNTLQQNNLQNNLQQNTKQTDQQNTPKPNTGNLQTVTSQRKKLRTRIRGGKKEDKKEEQKEEQKVEQKTSAQKMAEAKEWMEQRKKTLLARLQPKKLGQNKVAEGEEDEEELDESEEGEEGEEEEGEEEGEDEGEEEKERKGEPKVKKEKRPTQLSLRQIRAKKRESLRRNRIGELSANDLREYDNPVHWRTIVAMEPPNDNYPSTLKLRAEKIGEEIREKQKKKENMILLEPLFFKRGMLLLQAGQYVAAKSDFENCLLILTKSNSQDVKLFDQVYHMLAICLCDSKQYDTAFKVAKTISQVYVRVNILASILMQNGQFTKAIQYLNLLSEIYKDKSADIYYHMGKCYKALEKKKLALGEFTKAAAENPGNLQYRIAKAQQLKEAGKMQETKRTLKDIIISTELSLEKISELVQLYCEDQETYTETMQQIARKLQKQKSHFELGSFVNKIEQKFTERELMNSGALDKPNMKKEERQNPYMLFTWACQQLKLQKWNVAIDLLDSVLQFSSAEAKLLEQTKAFKDLAKENVESDKRILEFLNQKVTEHPDNADVYIERASVLFRLNDIEKAVVDTQQSLRIAPSAKAHHLLALLCDEGSAYKEASEHFQKAGELEGKPKHEVHAEIAAMYARNQEYEGVVDEYAIAIAYKPLPEYFVKKASAYAEMEEFPDAVMTLTEGMGLVDAKQYPSMYMLRAKYNQKLNDLIHASSDIKTAFAAFPNAKDPEWFSTRAAIYYAQQRFPEALSDCDYAIANSTVLYAKRLSNCYLLKAKISIDKKMFDFALQYIKEALKYDLETAECLYLRGRIYTNQGRYLLALSDFNKALTEKHSLNEYLYYLILAYRGFIHHHTGEKEESESDWDEVREGGHKESRELVVSWQQIMLANKNLLDDDDDDDE